MVQVYDEWTLIASHPRSKESGGRETVRDHLPPEKVEKLLQTPDWCRKAAAEVGPCTLEVVERLLAERPSDRLAAAQGILRLRKKVSKARLEAGCQRALAFGEIQYRTIKTLLNNHLEGEPIEEFDSKPRTKEQARSRFAREWTDLFPGPGEGEDECPPLLN